jgi:signal transduction histidine kinase
MRLSQFITENLEAILQEFEDFARSHTKAGETMDVLALRDDGEGILGVIALDLQKPQTLHAQKRKATGDAPSAPWAPETPAEQHGSERANSAFSLEETVSEYRALRASVLRLWIAAGDVEADAATLRDIIRFDEAIDQALAESMSRYSLEIERLLEERMAEDQRVEEGLARVKADFLRVVSHELRTPLNAIAGYSSILRTGISGPTTPAQEDVLGRMKQAEEHLLGVIEGILDFQGTSTATTYEMAESSVEAAIAGLDSIVDPTASTHGVDFDIDIRANGTRLWVDLTKVRQILLNLVSNALRFTPSGGRVWLDYVETTEHSCLRVHDTGKGIPSEMLEAIFEPFVQLDMGLTREQGGIGLGLSISRQLAEGMGGTLTAESEVGKGSVFTVALPRLSSETLREGEVAT